MNVVRIALASYFIAAMAVSASAADPKPEATNKEKIIGPWAMKRGDPPGSIWMFTRDGKLKMTLYQVNLTYFKEGTYQVDGNNLKYTIKENDGKMQTYAWKIKTLTDKTLILEIKQGDITTLTEEFKRDNRE